MTTLEVVEAVQRSLENEGVLQTIRAQLRASVLRIVASGPNYVPQSGKIVDFAQGETGSLALQLVRDLLIHCNLKETLSVFEAESGVTTSRHDLSADLGLSANGGACLLEALILKARHSVDLPSTGSSGGGRVETGAVSRYQEGAIVREPEFSEEESIAEESEHEKYKSDRDGFSSDEGEGYSALDAADPGTTADINKGPRAHMFTNMEATARAAANNMSSAGLDESSSFEADSPVNKTSAASKAFVPLEDSYTEADEFEESIQEEGKDEGLDNGSVEAPGKADDFSRSHEEWGPEYDSDRDEAKRSHDPAERIGGATLSEKPSPRSPESETAPEQPLSRRSTSSREDSRDAEDLEALDHSSGALGSLRPARAEDFDRLDHAGPADFTGGAASGARNRIAVRRAQLDSARGAEPGVNSGSGRANVNRLGQGAVSRSQTGWEADDIHNREDDFAGESDRSAADSPPRQHGRRGANDLETESFDEDDSPPRRIAPAASGSIRRSNNQEEEDREASRSKATEDGEESVVEEDFEADGSEGSDDEFEFNDDDAYIPSAGEARAQARNAFASPNKPLVSARSEADESGSQHAESEGEAEEEDEYADDGFDDADEEDADHGRGDKGPAVMPPAQRSLFAPATQPPQQQQQQALRRQADDEESVEESIPEEEDEADDMSVGQDSDADSGDVDFKHSAHRPGAAGSKPSGASQGTLSRGGPSGPLPKVGGLAGGRGQSFGALQDSFEEEEEEEQQPRRQPGSSNNISDRMREIDAKLEDMERRDAKGELAKLRQQHDDGDGDASSLASENIDEMEFSTGGGQNDSESSGEGSFSFLDSSSKK